MKFKRRRMFENIGKPKCDEIPMRERNELWRCNSFGKYGKIPMWNRDKLWKCNLIGDDDEIPRWNREYLWNHK